MDRTAYNKMHYDIVRKQSDALRKFREENPEKFAELMKQAQATVDTPIVRTITSYAPQNTLSESEIQEKIASINKEIIASRVGRKSFYIITNEHKYFGNFANAEEARQNYSNVISVEACTCPLCI